MVVFTVTAPAAASSNHTPSTIHRWRRDNAVIVLIEL